MPKKLIGVLALQGDAPEHRQTLSDIVGADRVVLVRSPADLEKVSALVLPGGESTTLSRLLVATGLRQPLIDRTKKGMSVLATCAGLILLSKRIEPAGSSRDPLPLGLLDVRVRRNDYGRQTDSFEIPVEVKGLRGGAFEASFIRAPRIIEVGKRVSILAKVGGSAVVVREDNRWGLTFHPELTQDDRIHRLFLETSGLL